MNTLTLPWGKESIEIKLPEKWQVQRMEPSPLPAVPDATAETQRSLAEPIGTARLSEVVKPGQNIVIVIDDDSRPTPVAQVLPAILQEIRSSGVSLEQITFVPALGVHRGMTVEEMEKRSGIQGVRFINPVCDDPAQLRVLGTTSRGTPVSFCKPVADADLIVSIGCIEPHAIASFGGGYKNLLPGVAGRASIAHNHSLNAQPRTFNMVGQPIETNPMRLDLEEAGKMLKPPVFIVNAVLNSAQKVVRVVSGDPVMAHRAGVRISAGIFGVEIPTLADVVITDSHPMDQDLRQGVKALANTIRALKPGGVMLTLVRAQEGVGVFGLANRKLPVGGKALRLLAPFILPLVPRLKLKGMGEEDRFFLYFALQAMLRGTLLLYAPTIPINIHERLPFVQFCSTPSVAVALAARKFPQSAVVLAFPYGGSTYPILP
jgi:nickel-dependent lactate racemase